MDPDGSEEIQNAEAYVTDGKGLEGNTWILDAENVSGSNILPTLKNVRHEGESFYDRKADMRYYFGDGKTLVAQYASNPVQRLEESLTFVGVESLGGFAPRKWMFSTVEKDYYLLRERSGSVRLINDAGKGETVFEAFVGREHPGTRLVDSEVIDLVTSVDYINIIDVPVNSVPQEAIDRYWETPDDSTADPEGLYAEMDDL